MMYHAPVATVQCWQDLLLLLLLLLQVVMVVVVVETNEVVCVVHGQW